MKAIRTFLGRIRNLFLLVWIYSSNRKIRHAIQNKPIVQFDLSDNHWHRYLTILVYFFRINNYQIYIKPNFLFLSNWASLSLFKQIPQLRIGQTSNTTIFICDHNDINHAVHLSYDYFNFDNHAYMVPMPMVDTMYHFDFWKNTPQWSGNNKRGIRLFFAGNIQESYTNTIIKEKFGLMDRNEILNCIQSNFIQQIEDYPRDATQLAKLKADIVLVDRNKYNINPERLIEVLSNCNFAIIPPGVVMPQTHFVVESMAAGCIPILQYRDMFHPSLDESNAIFFNNETDLVNCIKKALNMNLVDMNQMRKNVLAFYNLYLTPKAVVKHIVESNPKSIKLNAEYSSVLKK